jgi:hypothetical protein
MNWDPLIALPLPLPGRIFGSPMPFSSYDPEGEAFLRFKQEKVSLIVLLAEEEEVLRKASRNLKELYVQEGFQVIHIPLQISMFLRKRIFNRPSK